MRVSTPSPLIFENKFLHMEYLVINFRYKNSYIHYVLDLAPPPPLKIEKPKKNIKKDP